MRALTRDEARRIALNIAKIPAYRRGGAVGEGVKSRPRAGCGRSACPSRHRGRGGINNKIHTPSAAAIMPRTMNANVTSNMR
jgi:hypothetical protein